MSAVSRTASSGAGSTAVAGTHQRASPGKSSIQKWLGPRDSTVATIILRSGVRT
jgi:hypothetical protein